VSAPTYGSLADVPSDRVTRLAGPTEEQLAVVLDLRVVRTSACRWNDDPARVLVDVERLPSKKRTNEGNLP
jgi:hypothetical protein